MKDYSEFIKSEYGFITNIDIDKENNCIKVMTSKSKKGQPHIYVLTKERLDELYERLTNQYKLLIKNSEEIYEKENEGSKTLSSVFQIICISIAMVLCIIALISGKLIPVLLSLGISSICIGINKISKNKQKNFNEMIEMYKFYLENRNEIEEYIKKDLNIQSQIKDKTTNIISTNEELQNEELIDSIYDINLMDKVSLKELKNMLLRYKISKALDEEPYFECESSIETDENESLYEQIPEATYEELEEENCYTKKKIK